MHSRSGEWWIIAAIVAFSGVALAQANQLKRTLVVNGQSGDATIVQINGRSYIDLESLARIANGSLAFQGNQIVLTIPSSSADVPTMVPADRQPTAPGLSNNFMRAAIQDLATIKEWYSTLVYAIQRGVSGDGSRVFIYRDKAAQGLKLATVAASNDPDQSAAHHSLQQCPEVEQYACGITQIVGGGVPTVPTGPAGPLSPGFLFPPPCHHHRVAEPPLFALVFVPVHAPEDRRYKRR